MLALFYLLYLVTTIQMTKLRREEGLKTDNTKVTDEKITLSADSLTQRIITNFPLARAVTGRNIWRVFAKILLQYAAERTY
jgi:hypothetical protein